MKKRNVMVLLFCIVFVSSMFAPIMPIQYAKAATVQDSPKMVFLYVGYYKDGYGIAHPYPTYSVSDLNNLHADEFVITDKDNYSIFKDGTKSSPYSYDDLITFIKQTIDTIKQSNHTDAKVWIALPGMDSDTPFATIFPSFTNYLSDLQSSLGDDWSMVKGIYFNCEYPYTDGAFDYTNLLNNPVVQLATDLSNYIHKTYGIQFLWVPYLPGSQSNAADLFKRIGYITNTTQIFDYVLLQPGYYYNASSLLNLDAVSYSIAKQTITYRDGNSVLKRTANASAKIGVQMEIDGCIQKDYVPYITRYYLGVSKFSKFIGSYPISYYCGGADALSLTTPYINDFYYYSLGY